MTHARLVVASAAALCLLALSAPRSLADATPQRRLELAIEQKDAAAAKAALADLAAKDDEPSARAVLELCGKGAAILDLEDAAADALARMAGDAARKALFKAAKAEGLEATRYLAVVALGRVDSPDAREALVGALSG